MRQQELERFKQRLLDERTRLTVETDRMTQNIREIAAAPGDLSNVPAHNADRDTERLDAEVAVEQNERDILAQVEAALERIEAGTFGSCEQCGREIGRERLELMPHTAYCVHCAEKRESED
jgi:RNA polymerase-binding protein DksA